MKKIKAHEFHYYDSTDNGADCIATKPATGRSYDCVISHDNYWLGFPHLYYPSNPHFAESLVRKAYEYRRNKMETLINTLKTQIANIFRVTRDFRMTLIVCFVIVLCIVCQTVPEVRPT